MLIDPSWIGHIFLQFGRRSFYLAAPNQVLAPPDLLKHATATAVCAQFPNGIRYRLALVRQAAPNQLTADLLPADGWQERMEKRWLGPERDALITAVVLQTLQGELTFERGPRGLYRVAA